MRLWAGKRKLRLEKELKQVELAKILGVNEDTVRNWERGRTQPSGE
ncbi:MAG: helix-turn-helix transcriptional regulator [Nitrospinota bacterium]|jgi:DNA-binding transcriptional regulator YiaG|nr:helix-turn-helix transcriptional regulator [Nitrospinota bacterium]MDP7167932.1 helix-turn-helix transcriptional regulator [Nitrospinota bacterium]MDP7370177.1 helix-turn-helix transcriptional regulator [Nitrospinota bacterium]MDP7504832.1 helix-turn-helix transcriptional regulator [Nitrospinota bacterium]MDP7661945.1 helix-turn-helix transcriptional regulator [Nitrospinota bacterium]